MIVVSDRYTGTSSGQTITIPGSPGTPAFILIKAATGARIPVAWTTTMGADATKPMSGATALTAGYITAVGSSSFDVGTNAITNSLGVTYYYLAIIDDGQGDCKAGTYVGNGASNSVAVGIPIDLFFTMAATARAAAWKSSDMPGDDWEFSFASAVQADQGITIAAGTASFTAPTTRFENNENGVTYHYFAIAKSSKFSCGTFIGDGTSSHDVTPFILTPIWAMSQGSAQTNAAAVRFQDHSGDSSNLMGANNNAADRIQAFIANGIQVGGSDAVNILSDTYYAIGFAEGTSSGPTNPLTAVGVVADKYLRPLARPQHAGFTVTPRFAPFPPPGPPLPDGLGTYPARTPASLVRPPLNTGFNAHPRPFPIPPPIPPFAAIPRRMVEIDTNPSDVPGIDTNPSDTITLDPDE